MSDGEGNAELGQERLQLTVRSGDDGVVRVRFDPSRKHSLRPAQPTKQTKNYHTSPLQLACELMWVERGLCSWGVPLVGIDVGRVIDFAGTVLMHGRGYSAPLQSLVLPRKPPPLMMTMMITIGWVFESYKIDMEPSLWGGV